MGSLPCPAGTERQAQRIGGVRLTSRISFDGASDEFRAVEQSSPEEPANRRIKMGDVGRKEFDGSVDENLSELRRSLAGVVLPPGDAGYESARRCFNADDVATAFDFARTNALPVAVRGGGHNPAGHCVCEDGLVIDLSLMRRVDVD